jgi:N-acetylmuramic acid 6-phosphate etherase
MMDLSRLTTEQRNKRTRDVDRLSTLAIVDLVNSEDARIIGAVRSQRRKIAAAVELVTAAFKRGGRLFYVGAGTSGRLGVLDAAECPPTFGTNPEMVQGIIAGGEAALVRSVEGAEDKPETGAMAIEAKGVRAGDVLVGIAASGRTPFVEGALARARRLGVKTVLITCVKDPNAARWADIVVNPITGPEVVTGSTRMKAGTATKLVLNTITTAAMIKLGKVYGNLMVDLRATNEKLRDRAQRIVMAAAGVDRVKAIELLNAAQGHAKVAIVMHELGLDYEAAVKRLNACEGFVRKALDKG